MHFLLVSTDKLPFSAIFPSLCSSTFFDNYIYMKNEGRSFINRLRKHRRLMGYTQDDVAYLLDLRSSAQISRWEKGQAIPDTVNVIRLAYIYRTFTEELFREYYKQMRYDIEPREKKLAEMRLRKREQKKGKR